MNSMQEKINTLTEDELFALSCDFINFNRDITNDKIPHFFLKSWSGDYIKTNEPNGLALRVFFHILSLNYDPNENRSFYKSHQLLHGFQVIVATTIYNFNHDLPLSTVQLFRLDKYNIPKVEESEQLYTEYLKFVNPSLLKQNIPLRHKKVKIDRLLEIYIAPKLSNLILIEEFIQNRLNHIYSERPNLFEQINLCTLAAVKHAILFVNNDKDQCIKVYIHTSIPFLKVSILCGEEKKYEKKSTFNPPKAINKGDIKGHCLRTMKKLSDNISFLGNGAKVTLSFYYN